MTQQFYAYTMMNRYIVLEACKEYLKNREDRINREIESCIEYEMHGRRFFKAKTREKAIEQLKAEGVWSTWNEIHNKGAHWANVVSTIKIMCEKSTDQEVFMSDDSVYLLREYL